MRQRTTQRKEQPDARALASEQSQATLFSPSWSVQSGTAQRQQVSQAESTADKQAAPGGYDYSFGQVSLFAPESGAPAASLSGPAIQRQAADGSAAAGRAARLPPIFAADVAAPVIQRAPKVDAEDEEQIGKLDPEAEQEGAKLDPAAQQQVAEKLLKVAEMREAAAEGPAKSEQPFPVPAPQNMAEVYDQLRGGNEIKVFQVEGGDLVMLLDGSDPVDFAGINNLWKNAALSRLDIRSSYSRATDLVIGQLGKQFSGASIHLVGYSQGGIIAQNLSTRKNLFSGNGLTLRSCSTYGTPAMFPWNYRKGVDYSRDFDANGDLVSALGLPREAPKAKNFFKGLTAFAKIATVIGGIYTHTHAYGDKDSDIRQEMNATSTPYESKTWTLVDWFSDAEGFAGYRKRHGIEEKQEPPEQGKQEQQAAPEQVGKPE